MSQERLFLCVGVTDDEIDDAACAGGWQLTNIIPGDASYPRQLLYAAFDGGWLYLVDDSRFHQRWFQAEGPRQAENLAQARSLLACEPPGYAQAPLLRQAESIGASAAPALQGAALGDSGGQTEATEAASTGGTSANSGGDAVTETIAGIDSAAPVARGVGSGPAAAAASTSTVKSLPPPPCRPRLADHVLPRLHEMSGSVRLFLHDIVRGDALELEAQHFEVLRLADGTRDLEGVILEASRSGLLKRRSSIRGLLHLLYERGELAGGIAGEQRAAEYPTRPLRVLPGLALGCDQNGTCCRTYASMLFTREEAERALSCSAGEHTAPTAHGKPTAQVKARVFLPAFGTDESLLAVSTRDGACHFLGSDARCSLHALGAKPRGCSQYPLTFIDDGDSIRVAPTFECACVARSLLGELPGETVDLGDTEAELAPELSITRLPGELRLSSQSGDAIRLADLVGWGDRALASLNSHPEICPVAWLWHWAQSLEPGAEVASAARAAPGTSLSPPSLAELAPWLGRLNAHFRERSQAASWRAPADRTRRLVEWLTLASEQILDPLEVTRLLSGAWLEQSGASRQLACEREYLRCQIFGYHFAREGAPLADALMDRSARLVLARAMLEHCPPSCAADPSRSLPLTVIEALLRSQSLARKLDQLSEPQP